MAKAVLLGALLLTIGIGAGTFVGWRVAQDDDPPLAAPSPRVPETRNALVDNDGVIGRSRLERRLEALTLKLEQETAERRRLQERLDAISEQLAGFHDPSQTTTAPSVVESAAAPGAEAAGTQAEPVSSGEQTATERALIAAGVDPTAAVEITRRRDLLALDEIYLRDRATREGWLDSPRFAEEIALLEGERVSIRDEIGDDAYDRYLSALGHPNRVRVDEVLHESPAAQAGLQSGDVVLRYGEARIFAPNDLVEETRSGISGETVRLEIIRQGRRLSIAVPRGPLGVRVAGSQASPDEG